MGPLVQINFNHGSVQGKVVFLFSGEKNRVYLLDAYNIVIMGKWDFS